MTQQIKLTKGKTALVDDADFEELNRYKWTLIGQYACRAVYDPLKPKKQRLVFMHKSLLNCPAGMQIDHINRNPFDNRRSNLRICTARQNSYNRTGKNELKGISWKRSHNSWYSRIRFDNKDLAIGYFKSKLHAAMAYDIWAKELQGEYAKLNFAQ